MDNDILNLIQKLQLEVNDISEQLNLLTSNYYTLLSEDILDKFNTLTSAITSLQANYNSLSTKAQEISTLLSSGNLLELNQTTTILHDSILQLTNTNNSSHEILSNSIDLNRTEIENLQFLVNSITQQITQLQQQLDNLPTNNDIDFSNITSQIQTLQDCISQTNSAITDLETKIDNINLTLLGLKEDSNKNAADITEIKMNLNSIINNINSLNAKIQTMQEVSENNNLKFAEYLSLINEALLQTQEYQQTISNLQSAVDTNSTDITALQSDLINTQNSLNLLLNQLTEIESSINTHSTKIDSHTSDISMLIDRVSVLVTQSSIQTQDIISLIGKDNLLEARIEALENSDTGQECEPPPECPFVDTISTMQNEIEGLKDLIADYHPKQDENKLPEIPYAGTDLNIIYKTEDSVHLPNISKFNGSKNHVVHYVAFSCNSNTETTIRVKFTTYNNRVASYILKLVLNGVEIATRDLPQITEKQVEYLIDETFTDLDLSNGGGLLSVIIYGGHSYGVGSKDFYCHISAPNINIINKPKSIDINHYLGKYYISDCNSGTAKICEIEAKDLHRSENIKFTDTGIVTHFYFSHILTHLDENGNLTHSLYRINGTPTHLKCVIKSDDGLLSREYDSCYHIAATDSFHTNSIQGNLLSEFIKTPSASSLEYTHQLIYARYPVLENLKGSGMVYYNQPNLATMTPVKYLVNYWENAKYETPCVCIYFDGNVRLFSDIAGANGTKFIDLGFGCNARAYIISDDKKLFDVYINVFGKIIRKRLKFESNAFTLLSEVEIGEYDDYFRGVNNDYFVVKDGVISYFKDQT